MTRTILCALALALASCGPESSDPCPDYCAKLDECGDARAADCPESCAVEVASYEYSGEACGAHYGDYVECRTAATCGELADEGARCGEQQEALLSDACTLEICDRYAERLVECGLADEDWKLGRADECTVFLRESRFEVSDACGDAKERLMACVVAASCEQIDSGEGCKAEEAASDKVCL